MFFTNLLENTKRSKLPVQNKKLNTWAPESLSLLWFSKFRKQAWRLFCSLSRGYWVHQSHGKEQRPLWECGTAAKPWSGGKVLVLKVHFKRKGKRNVCVREPNKIIEISWFILFAFPFSFLPFVFRSPILSLPFPFLCRPSCFLFFCHKMVGLSRKSRSEDFSSWKAFQYPWGAFPCWCFAALFGKELDWK